MKQIFNQKKQSKTVPSSISLQVRLACELVDYNSQSFLRKESFKIL